MNITNDDALDVMVSIGRQALERGKVDQALTILSGVVTKAPKHAVAWFSLGRAHLARGSRDHAAMCYQRASALAAAQRGAAAANLLGLARDNMRLCAEKVLPQDWLPALQDPHIADRWAAALEALAADAASPAQAEGTADTAQQRPLLHALVVGGIGLQALLLQTLLTAQGDGAGAGAGSGAPQGAGSEKEPSAAEAPAAPPPATVTWIQPDELSRTLAAQMAAAAGVPRTDLRVMNGWDAVAAAAEAAQADAAAAVSSSSADAGANTQPAAAAMANMLVAVGLCTARLALREWAATLAQARPLLAPGAALCPSRLRLVGALVASEDLTAMNEVRLDWMAEDSGGLQYGPANELLWRPARSMQVSGMRYSLLSEPFQLLPEITARQLLLEPEQLLGPGAAACGASGAESAAASRSGSGSGAQPLRHEVIVVPSAGGRVDCVVCWTEYELAPGVWLSYSPHEMQGRSDPPALSPHVWQRVQYLSARPSVAAGAPLVLQVTLSTGGDDIRVEYDEDVTAVHRLSLHRHRHRPPPSGTGTDADGPDDADGSALLPPGEPLLPEGEPLLPPGPSAESGSDDERAADDGSGGGGRGSCGAGADDDVAATAAAAPTSAAAATRSQTGLILPYHMSMLNDRERNRRYLRGIAGAVEAARARQPAGEPLVVLDVGAGTGLLSMAAARAGAEVVVGCERELALAVTAGALAAANDLTDRVTVVQLHSKDLRVAPQQPEGQPPQQQLQPPPPPQQQQQDDEKEEQEGRGSQLAAAAPLQPHHLPRRAHLVVHEIFGTDPLSEHILPSLAQVQEALAAPDAAFLPCGFRIVAALAHSDTLEERMRLVRPPPLGLAPGAAARLCKVLPAAAAAALQPWAPWKAELDLLRVPDLLLLSEPVAVLTLRLGGGAKLPRGSYRAAAAAPPLRRPMPVAQLFARHGPSGAAAEPAAAAPSPAAAQPTAGTCVVYWFEADCGAGGWLSTRPGSPCTYYGHWVQNVHFLEEPLPLPLPLLTSGAAGEAAGSEGGEGEGEGCEDALRVMLSAECVMDRVRMSAEWVVVRQGGSGGDSSSGSGDDDEEEEED